MALDLYSTPAMHNLEVVCAEAHSANSNYANCKINPGHKNFLTVAEFGSEHLYPEYRTEENMKKIQRDIDRTVKITVSSTSSKRPDTFLGRQVPYPFIQHRGSNSISRCSTGFIQRMLQKCECGPCPCPDCKRSKNPKLEYWEFILATATHVVFDDMEAESVVVELFYDTEDKQGVQHLFGLYVTGSYDDRYRTDVCEVVCITHEAEVADRLTDICEKCLPSLFIDIPQPGVLISHPHGVSKRISVGVFFREHFVTELGDTTINLEKGTCVYIPPKHDQQEFTQHCDCGCVSDTNPSSNEALTHKQIVTSIKSIDKETPAMNNTVKPEGNVASLSKCNFYHFFKPTGQKGMFTLKVETNVIIPPKATVILHPTFNRDYSCEENWWLFESEAKFVSPDESTFSVPVGTKVLKNNTKLNYIFDKWPNYLSYDMATCPGSSGAFIHYLCTISGHSDSDSSGGGEMEME